MVNENPTIHIPTRVKNYLDKQKQLLGNEHKDNIAKLLKDSKEFRDIRPDASYTETKKWELKAVWIDQDLRQELNKLRAAGMMRTGAGEYSYARIINDIYEDSIRLNEMEQTAMVDKNVEEE